MEATRNYNRQQPLSDDQVADNARGLFEAIGELGGYSKAGRLVGRSRSTVRSWVLTGKIRDDSLLAPIAEATGREVSDLITSAA